MKRIFKAIALLAALGGARAAAQETHTSLVSLETYKPAYFLQGQPDTKIQIGFKYRLVQDENLYFGYSQLMIWQFVRANSRFSDLNYNPEIFYRFPLGDGTRWVDFGPFEHESDGKSGVNARSWNRTYVRGHDAWALGSTARLTGEFKAWVPYFIDPSSKNIPEYRGLYETNLTLSNFLGGFFDCDELTFRLYPGGPSDVDPTRGGQELTLRLHWSRHKRKATPVLTFQVFHGFAESLLTYNRSYWAWRAGIGF